MTTTPTGSENSNSSVAITPVDEKKNVRVTAKRAPAPQESRQSEATIADVEVFEPEPEDEATKPRPKRQRAPRKKPGVRKPAAKKPASSGDGEATTSKTTDKPKAKSAQPTDRRSKSRQPVKSKKLTAKPAAAKPAAVATGESNKPAAKKAEPEKRKKKKATSDKKKEKAVATIAPTATVKEFAPAEAPTKSKQSAPVQRQPAPGKHGRPIPVAPGQNEAVPDEDPDGDGTQFLISNAVPSWMVSMVVHAIILLVLAMMLIPPPEKDDWPITMGPTADREIPEELTIPVPEDIKQELQDTKLEEFVPDKIEHVTPDEVNQFNEMEVLDQPPPATVNLNEFSERNAPRKSLLDRFATVSGNGLNQRSGSKRAAMVAAAGGTPQSEAAVAMALEWLAQHQARDGSWCFNHNAGPCNGRCANPGNIGPDSRIGSTAMALLPFLGAGQTHREGKYKANVQAGLYFLTRAMKVNRGMGDLTDGGGRMYSHGLAAIALTEAYGMTKDKALQGPAQLSVNFIVYAQDPVGGGWRYKPHQPGDTSVVGWQIMALKSAHLAYLRVPPETVRKASKFLDSVQVDYGSQYGYTAPGPRVSTTAVGLLCRMLLGWKKQNPSLQKGVQILSNVGPSHDMYFNYYATQVLRHYGGKEWTKWNEQMRDMLVESQSKKGHQKGSWFVGQDHGTGRGGRLYSTCMATMILEVYYRHMPIYGRQASDEDFPL